MLQALATLDDELDELELGLIDELELEITDELTLELTAELDIFDELRLELTTELELETFIELELDLLDELTGAVDDTPEPLVGTEHSFVVLAGFGSVPKVAVLHTNVPFNTL